MPGEPLAVPSGIVFFGAFERNLVAGFHVEDARELVQGCGGDARPGAVPGYGPDEPMFLQIRTSLHILELQIVNMYRVH